MRRRIAAALAVSLVVVACSARLERVTLRPPGGSQTGAVAPTPSTANTATTPTTVPTDEITDAPSVQVAGARTEQSYDAFVARVVIDLEAFWVSAYPEIADGEAFEPLRGGLWPVWPGANGVPGCGERETRYREVASNAFYCPEADFIAFDDADLFPSLDDRFGHYTIATVLAHEWGHAVQARRGYSMPGVITELQADCFGGAWMGRVRGGAALDLDLSDADLRRAIGGILAFRDDIGTSADDAGAHGSAFDRLGSFQDGFEGGPTACDGYAASPPVVLELPFNSTEDFQREGDLPLNELVTDIPADLDRFWVEALQGSGTGFPRLSESVRSYQRGGPYPRCTALSAADFDLGVVYCPSPEFVAYEEGGSNAELHATIGDFSVGVLFADRWAEALQHRLGLSTDGQSAALQRDCLTGVWVGDIVPRPTRAPGFVISPGDLDEAVQTYLHFTDHADESADEALARIRSFRDGVFSGLTSCGI